MVYFMGVTKRRVQRKWMFRNRDWPKRGVTIRVINIHGQENGLEGVPQEIIRAYIGS